MSKDNVVIEEGGMRYVMQVETVKTNCGFGGLNPCKYREYCKEGTALDRLCDKGNHRILSATKIQPEPKMYFAWNREEARHLVGKVVEFHGGYSDDEWIAKRLEDILDEGIPFALYEHVFSMVIRELPTTKLTLAQLIEMAGIEGDVEIVEE